MKQIPITLVGERQLQEVFNVAQRMPLDSTVEVVFRNAKQTKTLAQLGVLFGLWMDEISTVTGHSEEYIHKWLKCNFLAPVYANDPQGPIQEQWAELYWIHMESQNTEALAKHIDRVSMAHTWGYTKEQMTKYLNQVKAWGNEQDMVLTVPSQFHKFYKEEAARAR